MFLLLLITTTVSGFWINRKLNKMIKKSEEYNEWFKKYEGR